ncbi:glycoside hydrolase family 31 protein [Myxococcota bacterium]|nr:glycoside hydrolase family 31 protein [Myxococcota bacterium]
MRRLACIALAWMMACGGGGGGSPDVLPDQGTDPGAPGDVVADSPAEVGPGDLPDGRDLVPQDLPAEGGTDPAGEEIEEDPGPEEATLGTDTQLVVSRDERTLSLWVGGKRVLLVPPDGLRLGLVDELDENVSYDPWPLVAQEPAYTPPDGLRWETVTRVRIAEAGEDRILLALTFGTDIRATLEILSSDPGRFRLVWTPASDRVAFVSIRPQVRPEEAFYGLGAWLDQAEHRGTLRAMQLEADDLLEGRYNEAHVGIPFLIGTEGWGLFVASRHPGVFDVARSQEDRVDAVFGTAFDTSRGVEFHLFAEAHPRDITRHYYEVTGHALLPARWGLGPVIWRDEIDGQQAVLEDLETIRDLDLPTTAYWIDRPYANGVNSFDFHRDHYPDPQAMIDRAHALGFRMALWHTPYVSEDRESSPETIALAREARNQGYFPPVTGLRLNHWSDPIDLSNPEAYTWWQGLIRRYTDMGIEGFKLDYGEDIVPGLLGIRSVWRFADGTDERTMHSRWRLLYHRVYAETLPPDGGFLLCRAGSWGDQVNVSVIWPGDLDANFARHRDPIPGDPKGYAYVGGLPASVVYGLSLGPSGFPFFGADTGGYRHSPPDRETFMRWYQQTALSSVMQVGTSSNDVAWEFTLPDGSPDVELLDNYREFARLHLRLFPYEWTLAKDIARTGYPIERPLGLEYPAMGRHPSDTYLFGPSLLVAPVLTQGQRQRTVLLPPGRWRHWFTGDVFDGGSRGGAEITVAADLTELPLFQREGSVIPMLRPTIDAIAPTLEPERVDSLATDAGLLHVRVFPGPAEDFPMYDGTVLSQSFLSPSLVIGMVAGTEYRKGAIFEVVGVGNERPLLVRFDGGPGVEASSLEDLESLEGPGWFFEEGVLRVRVPAAGDRVQVLFPSE